MSGAASVAPGGLVLYVNVVQAWLAVAVGCAAIIDDLRRRRIANWIPAVALVGGLLLMSVEAGWRGVGSAVLGSIAGGAAFLIFFLRGGMGGGDIKLMAGFGALLGPARVLEAALWAAACGGLIAVIVIAVSRLRRGAQEPNDLPYAPAIALGVWLSLVPRG